MNGSAKLILTVLGLIVVLALAIDGYQSAAIQTATMCANDAKETAARVEEREQSHFDEVIRRLDRIENKLE